MIAKTARSLALALLSVTIIGFNAKVTRAQAPPEEKPAVFRIKYVTGDSVYLAAGRNLGIEEGMKLSVVKPPPDGATDNGIRFRGYEHVAEIKVMSVADSSSICEILSTNGEVRVGQFAFLTVDSVQERRELE